MTSLCWPLEGTPRGLVTLVAPGGAQARATSLAHGCKEARWASALTRLRRHLRGTRLRAGIERAIDRVLADAVPALRQQALGILLADRDHSPMGGPIEHIGIFEDNFDLRLPVRTSLRIDGAPQRRRRVVTIGGGFDQNTLAVELRKVGAFHGRKLKTKVSAEL